MTRLPLPLLLVAFLAIGAALPGQQDLLALPQGIEAAADRAISAGFVKSTLTWLASDEMKGRDTPSPELDAAAEGLAQRFEGFGLKPAFGESWFQGPHAADLERAAGLLVLAGREVALDATSLASPFRGEQAEVKDAALRPLALGAALDADPPPSGAAILLVPAEGARQPSRSALRTWFQSLSRAHPGLVMVSEGVPSWAGRYFSAPVLALPAGVALTDLEQARISFRIPDSGHLFARNVGALLRGADPELADEVIVFSAHYDHIGVGPAVNGDGIYNGADDDASGSTAVVAIARAFAELPKKPRRSVLFLLFYGEEKGLLGSRWYCEHPAVPLDRTRAAPARAARDAPGSPAGGTPTSARSSPPRALPPACSSMSMKA